MRISGMRAPLRSLPLSIINLLGVPRKAPYPRPLVVFDVFAHLRFGFTNSSKGFRR
jgi:hypothetical protein